jgi:acetolactate decarboxylase
MQQQPYKSLVEVVKTQPVFQLETVKGTMVGFRCPVFAAGLNVPGYHFHFISDDRKSGGHVLDARLLAGAVGIDATPAFLLALPSDAAFTKADLSTDKPADVQKVEK